MFKHNPGRSYLAEGIENSIRISCSCNGRHALLRSKSRCGSCDDISEPCDDYLNVVSRPDRVWSPRGAFTGKGPRPTTIKGPLMILMLWAGPCRAWDFWVSVLIVEATSAGVITAITGKARATAATILRNETISKLEVFAVGGPDRMMKISRSV